MVLCGGVFSGCARVQAVMKAATAGRRVAELCEMGDKFITDATGKMYKQGKVTKGIGFPTCISVNNIVGSFAPPATDVSELKPGDVVKVDLGVHLDGYLAMVRDGARAGHATGSVQRTRARRCVRAAGGAHVRGGRWPADHGPQGGCHRCCIHGCVPCKCVSVCRDNPGTHPLPLVGVGGRAQRRSVPFACCDRA